MEVYMDNSATTRTFPEVAELMTKIMCEDYGNPSSLHMKGVEAEKYLRYAGYDVNRVMNITDVGHLTSDADEGEDKMLKGARREHKTVMEIAQYYTDAF